MAKWYPLQESSEPVPLAGRVEGQELKHTQKYEMREFYESLLQVYIHLEPTVKLPLDETLTNVYSPLL